MISVGDVLGWGVEEFCIVFKNTVDRKRGAKRRIFNHAKTTDKKRLLVFGKHF
jgi:hypothetical protein